MDLSNGMMVQPNGTMHVSAHPPQAHHPGAPQPQQPSMGQGMVPLAAVQPDPMSMSGDAGPALLAVALHV